MLAPRALVADDDLQVRSTMVRMIQSLGFTCLEAGNGEEALSLLENEGEVPLVISDINMPGMDGLGLLEGILARYPDTAIIMLSGVAEVKTADDGLPTQFVTVVEVLRGDGPPVGSEQFVTNLPSVQGFSGPGQYLLLVTLDPVARMVRANGPEYRPFTVVGQQRSPGNDLAGVGKPLVYLWSDDMRRQFETLPKPR